MSIYLYCKACRSTSPLKSKVCSKCQQTFPKEGRKYRVSVTNKGKTVNRIVDNLTIAKETDSTIKADLLRDEYDITNHQVKEKPATLGDVWGKYLSWAKEHKSSWRDDVYYYQKHLEPRFKDKPLEEISPMDVEKMKVELKKGLNARGTPYKEATIKHQLVLLRHLFNVAIKWEMFKGVNPISKVSMPKVDNQVTEFMTDEQAQNLLDVLETWPCRDSAAFVKVAMFTGMRRGELFKLMWKDVDLERGFVTLRSPKGGKTTTLPVGPDVVEVLRKLPQESEYVFPGKEGKQRVDFKGPWGRIKQAAGLPGSFRFHGLRHNFASHLVSNGVDLTIVKELLTHKDLSMTQRYAHLKPEVLQQAAKQSGELIKPQNGKARNVG